MKKNMGSIDRLIRILIVLVVVLLYYFQVLTGTLGVVLLIAALVLAVTSFLGFCPLYFPFGISTNKKK